MSKRIGVALNTNGHDDPPSTSTTAATMVTTAKSNMSIMSRSSSSLLTKNGLGHDLESLIWQWLTFSELFQSLALLNHSNRSSLMQYITCRVHSLCIDQVNGDGHFKVLSMIKSRLRSLRFESFTIYNPGKSLPRLVVPFHCFMSEPPFCN
jgi:hypothetical protein